MEVVDSPLATHIDTDDIIATELDLQLTLTPAQIADEIEEEESEDEEEEEEEPEYDFSFACADASSPISAEELFDKGQIKPIFPWLGNDDDAVDTEPGIPVFVERKDVTTTTEEDIGRVAEGPYCAWSKTTDSTSSAPESCRKSNSTGFSKLRRFRDLLHRSQSDGKDTFVFLTTEKKAEKEEKKSSTASSSSSNKDKKKSTKKGKEESKTTTTTTRKGKGKAKAKAETRSSLASYAMQYGEKGKEKRRSYLPYRQDLVGFFTNASVMSKNIHPY